MKNENFLKLELGENEVFIFWKKSPKLSPKDRYREQHRLARELLSKALKRLYNIDFNESLLTFNEHDKPYLKDYPDIYFNISHSNRMIIVALCKSEIGIDVEDTYQFSQAMIKRVFSYEERVKAKDFKNVDEYYTRLWTLKESYTKCRGSGLSFPLSKISFSIENSYPLEFEKNYTGAYFYQDKIGESVFSICLNSK